MSSGLGALVAERAMQVVAERENHVTSERAPQTRAHVGEGVGALATAEFAQLSHGEVQVTAAMVEASVSHEA